MKPHKHPYIPNYIQHPHKLCLEIELDECLIGPTVLIRYIAFENYENLNDLDDEEIEALEYEEETIIPPRKWIHLNTPSKN